MKIDTKESAILAFRELVARYGLQWSDRVPPEAYDRLTECNRFLTEADRRSALGLKETKAR